MPGPQFFFPEIEQDELRLGGLDFKGVGRASEESGQGLTVMTCSPSVHQLKSVCSLYFLFALPDVALGLITTS